MLNSAITYILINFPKNSCQYIVTSISLVLTYGENLYKTCVINVFYFFHIPLSLSAYFGKWLRTTALDIRILVIKVLVTQMSVTQMLCGTLAQCNQ